MDLKKRINQGIPSIIILPGIQETVQHASIVSGYDSEERRILTYVPEPDTIGAIPESQFERDWEQDDMITLVLIPNDMKDIFKNDILKFRDSNRICFEAEKLHQQGNINDAMGKLRELSNWTMTTHNHGACWEGYIMRLIQKMPFPATRRQSH